MTISLFTRDGGFVHTTSVPAHAAFEFNELPGVVFWGERVFVRAPDGFVGGPPPSTASFGGVVASQPAIPYVEAFTYAIPPEMSTR